MIEDCAYIGHKNEYNDQIWYCPHGDNRGAGGREYCVKGRMKTGDVCPHHKKEISFDFPEGLFEL